MKFIGIFEGTQETNMKQAAITACLLPLPCYFLLTYPSTLKVEANNYSETLVDFHQTTWRHIPVDRTFNSHRCEHINSNMSMYISLVVQVWLATFRDRQPLHGARIVGRTAAVSQLDMRCLHVSLAILNPQDQNLCCI
jgi:hypothetical protein